MAGDYKECVESAGGGGGMREGVDWKAGKSGIRRAAQSQDSKKKKKMDW